MMSDKWIVDEMHGHSEETMRRDLTDGAEKPLWPLSSYGPGKHEPTLINALDESPEEMRVKAWEANRSGQLQTYVGVISSSQFDFYLICFYFLGFLRNHPDGSGSAGHTRCKEQPSTEICSSGAVTAT